MYAEWTRSYQLLEHSSYYPAEQNIHLRYLSKYCIRSFVSQVFRGYWYEAEKVKDEINVNYCFN